MGNKTLNPTKIICLGLNYKDHIEETHREIPEEPLLFNKTLNCLIGHKDPIIYPKILYNNKKYNRVDYEAELAVIIKKEGKYISEDSAYEYILGYSVFNDITARKMQIKDISAKKPWFKSKSFDTFGVIGPKVVKLDDPHNLNLELKLNGERKQFSNTKYLIFKIPYLIHYISQFFTLKPDDIIATGTPSGIGPISPGDVIEISIENIGTLRNEVLLEE
ncbi:MAG: FAA hydrolase family protein [Promethearchaeota archaeon]|nr:MAG: FAA hydrolase family protein [Candidatus Lokiarchaeota archaeon]